MNSAPNCISELAPSHYVEFQGTAPVFRDPSNLCGTRGWWAGVSHKSDILDRDLCRESPLQHEEGSCCPTQLFCCHSPAKLGSVRNPKRCLSRQFRWHFL